MNLLDNNCGANALSRERANGANGMIQKGPQSSNAAPKAIPNQATAKYTGRYEGCKSVRIRKCHEAGYDKNPEDK